MPRLKPYRKAPWTSAPTPRKLSEDYDFYNSASWRKLAKSFLHQPENVICKECKDEGRFDAATVVDHIVPIRLGGAKRDELNLQGLCTHHHAIKSGKEKHGYCVKWKLNDNDDKIPL